MWRTIRETVIRCMHVDSPTECSPWTVWCHLLRRAITRWEHSIKLQSGSIGADSKIKLIPTHKQRKVVWPPHPVIIHGEWLAITLMPSHFNWHSHIGQLSKKLSKPTLHWWTEGFLSKETFYVKRKHERGGNFKWGNVNITAPWLKNMLDSCLSYWDRADRATAR